MHINYGGNCLLLTKIIGWHILHVNMPAFTEDSLFQQSRVVYFTSEPLNSTCNYNSEFILLHSIKRVLCSGLLNCRLYFHFGFRTLFNKYMYI